MQKGKVRELLLFILLEKSTDRPEGRNRVSASCNSESMTVRGLKPDCNTAQEVASGHNDSHEIQLTMA